MRSERLPNGHVWFRIAEQAWANPLDPSYAEVLGGRWNPPNSFPTLYLNEDLVTARFNLELFISGWPYEPEDLVDANGPVLVGAELPRRQVVADVHTPAGVAALGLPATYPFDKKGVLINHKVCQPIGQAVKAAGLKGLRCRSAQTGRGAGRELAWFPATRRSLPRHAVTQLFTDWYWA